jgi:hypothetical protein
MLSKRSSPLDNIVGNLCKTTRSRRRREWILGRAVVETLEKRVLLSFVVTTIADSSSTSGALRYEIQQADTTGGDQTITFDPSLTASGPATIALGGSALILDDTSGTLTIQGPGANLLTVNGESLSSVFSVSSGTGAQIEDLSAINGDGSGIINAGTLTLISSTISGSVTTGNGGGIYSAGLLSISDTTISGNSGVDGGGIDNYGSLFITNSTISGNSASGLGGGIANDSSGAVETIFDSTIAENVAGSGGGIQTNSSGTITLEGTIIAQNTGGDEGGGATSTGTYTNPATIYLTSPSVACLM